MAISRFYDTLYYVPLTYTETATGKTRAYVDANKVSFQGVINQNSSTERDMAGKVGVQANYKLFCGVSVDFPADCIIYDGTHKYRVISDDQIPKNTVNRNHHYRILLETINAEIIGLT